MNYSAKNIFLIDSIGAFVTALLLSQVLARFETFFGMPVHIAKILAGIAFCFSIYSLICQFKFRKSFNQLLKVIIAANTLYCLVTTCAIIEYFNKLTAFGLAYFIGEIFIILLLVFIEYNILKKAKNTNYRRNHS